METASGLGRGADGQFGWHHADSFYRITRNGDQLAPVTPIAGRDGNLGAVMWDGENWMVVHWVARRLALRRVNPAGAIAGARVFLNDGNAAGNQTINTLEVAFAGDRFAVLWHEWGSGRLVFVVYDLQGVRLSAPGLHVRTVHPGHYRPGLVWTGRKFLVSWDQAQANGRRRVVIARYDEVGNPVGGLHQVNIDGGVAYAPSLAWAGDRLGVAWVDTVGARPDTWFVSSRYDCP